MPGLEEAITTEEAIQVETVEAAGGEEMAVVEVVVEEEEVTEEVVVVAAAVEDVDFSRNLTSPNSRMYHIMGLRSCVLLSI